MESSTSFAFKMFVFSLSLVVLMSMMMIIFVGQDTDDSDELLDGYFSMTGTQPTSEAVWCLTGIYTPYGTGINGAYGYTDDGWLYGSRVTSYAPAQYSGTDMAYTVTYENGQYRYASDTAYGSHTTGDLYTNVTFDGAHKSNIFFTEQMRHTDGIGQYYDYTGYRFAFQPSRTFTTYNSGTTDSVTVNQNTSSLSLIWYEYYYQSGIAGQLIISGSDTGVGYLTAENIIHAFNSTTSTATFTMSFNGIDCRLHIRLDPTYIANGTSIEDCYNNGYWSLMVTSPSTDADAYTGSDYALNLENIFDTITDILTFDYSGYNIDGAMGTLCTILICLPLYATLLALSLNHRWVLILAALLVAVQSFSMSASLIF